MERVVEAYRNRARVVGTRFDLARKDVVLAFDHTEEDYYGKLASPYLHAWTGEAAVTGKWKFLTCAIVNHDDPPKVPLVSLPTPIGYDVSKQIAYIINAVKPLVGSIQLTLYDRGFYSRDLMRTLTDLHVPYLILVPKNEPVKRELDAMRDEERKTVHRAFRYYKNKTTQHGETTLALLKHIFDPKSKKTWDWAFATNQDEVDLDHIIRDYKGRWRIETGFRVQDQARIASSSTEVQVRFFYFAFEQALQFAWGALFKDDAPYKAFLYQLSHTSNHRVEREQAKGRPHAGARP